MPDFEEMTPEQMQKMAAQMQEKEYEGLTPEERTEKEKQKERQKQENISLLEETMTLCQEGSYELDGNRISLGLSREEMSEIQVFLPDEIQELTMEKASGETPVTYSCVNQDALSFAREKMKDPDYQGGRILVLDLASATRPGGASRDGANGQEEDFCRKSSLLLSLESESAKRYYDYNNGLKTHLGSDAVMVTPNVAVIRDEKNDLLKQPVTLSVASCAAPMIRMGLEGKSEEEYQDLLLNRITGILKCARHLGYQNLVLGAFGCGVFGNDAAVVSDLFRKALDGPEGKDFKHVDFAVLCQEGKEYNYNEFCRNFGTEI